MTSGTGTVNYRLITNVNVSPVENVTGSKNAGPLHDNPVLWFHGATSGTGLPSFQVTLGLSQITDNSPNQGQSPLNALGYEGTNPVIFDTSATGPGIDFGIFPKTAALWVEGSLSLAQTTGFQGLIDAYTNQGLLGTSGANFLQSK